MNKTLGLILEINPFHNGHQYFIRQAIALDQYTTVIAVVSTSFCMRGEISVIDKFEKTKLLLENGIDLVLELPIAYSINSSDYFTSSSIEILAKMGVTDICFGTEASNLEDLIKLSHITSSTLFQESIKKQMNAGLSLSASSILALKEQNVEEELIKEYSLPNNTLALGYIKAIQEKNLPINIHNIKRIENQYYEDNVNQQASFASALALRNELDKNNDISNFIPSYHYDFVRSQDANEKLYDFLKYEFITKDLSVIKTRSLVSEGIENRMNSFLNLPHYDNFVSSVSTKRYSASRIKRTILQIVLNNTLSATDYNYDYLRILGMSEAGKKHLSKLDKSIKNQLITNIKKVNDNKILDLELKATKLYDLLTNKSTFINEFQTPIKK